MIGEGNNRQAIFDKFMIKENFVALDRLYDQ